METLSIFIYSVLILFAILISLLIIPKIISLFKKKKKHTTKTIESKEEKVNDKIKTIRERKLWGKIVSPFILSVLIFLFLIFETQITNFLERWVDVAPFNYVTLFTIIGLIFIVKGSITALKPGIRNMLNFHEVSKKKNELNENSTLIAFVWIMQGFILTMVALFSELITATHVILFNVNFSWIVVLLVVWEFLMVKSVLRTFRHFKLI